MLFNTEVIHLEEQSICPKVNIIARLEFELAYYDSADQRFNHYTTRIEDTPHWCKISSCVWDYVIYLYLEIPENFLRLLL